MRNILAAVSLLAIAACLNTRPDGPTGPVASVAIVASEGGSLMVTTADNEALAGLVLDIPAGALAADTTITADRVADIADAPAGPAVDFGPDGTTFSGGATLTLPLSDTAPLANLYVQVKEADGSTSTLETPTVDSELRTVTVTVDGFTRFQPAHRTPCEVEADCATGEACHGGLCAKDHTAGGCSSDAECASGQVCTSGSCVATSTTCTANSDCASGESCVDGACHGNTTTAECTTDADCRTFSNYCDGCNCEALPANSGDPTCGGTTVQCFADPCMNDTAVCISGHCSLESTTSTTCASDADCASGQICYAGACVSG